MGGSCFMPPRGSEDRVWSPHCTKPPKGLGSPLLLCPGFSNPPRQTYSLGSEVICSQTGIVNLQDNLGVLDGGTKNLEDKRQEVGTSLVYWHCPPPFFLGKRGEQMSMPLTPRDQSPAMSQPSVGQLSGRSRNQSRPGSCSRRNHHQGR